MARQARLDFPGTLHHAICRGIERRRIVADDRDRDNFVNRLGQAAVESDTDIYAWSLMTNHAHILLRSGKGGISQFMRKLLTGYAVSYNLRHKRHGYLFQNRYKSIVCEEDPYFLELIRYIHLNPIRAGVVRDIEELGGYHYSGHRVLMGKVAYDWQDREYVLKEFGETERRAKKEYKKFIEAAIGEGRRPELVGGGLIRSAGGWSRVISMRRQKQREQSDERILGSGKFVEKMIEEAEERQKHQFTRTADEMKGLIDLFCRKEGITTSEVKGGSRRRIISQMRKKIVRKLIERHGIPMAAIAREIGVSPSAVSKIMKLEQ